MTIIAIDGPVGSGKSTVARAVARRLGLRHLDTGAMYRSVALAALRRGIDPGSADAEVVAAVARDAAIEVNERVLLDGEDVTSALRSPEVGRAVSAVAARPEVRAELVRRQRQWAENGGGGVVEGRDIGSVVFPDAALKVFLTASDEERARRRQSDETSADLARRDRLDSIRTVSPLVVVKGAHVIDSTGRSIDAIVEEIVAQLAAASPEDTAPGGQGPERPVRAGGTGAPPRRGGRAGGVSARGGSTAQLLLYRVCRALVVGVCRSYWRASYEGLEHVPRSGAFVIAPVHRSFIDFGLVAGLSRRRIRYMGKEELWKYPAFGWLFAALGAFPVHRSAADREALRRSLAAIEEGEPLVLFPEGTRRSGPIVEGLHHGASYVASRAGVPVLPVGIGGSERALRKGRRLPRPVRVHIVVGPPLLPPESQGRHPSRRAVTELTERLRSELQRLFDRAETVVGSRPAPPG